MIDNDTVFAALTQQQIQTAVSIIQQANQDFYPFFIIKKQTPQEFCTETLKLIKLSFQVQSTINQLYKKDVQFNHTLRKDGKMIGVIINIDIIEFYKSISHLTQVSQFYSMFKIIPISQLEVGQRVYQTRVSILPQHMGKGYGKKMLYESIKYLTEKGYNASYEGILIEASFRLYKSFGCQILIQITSSIAENYMLTIRFARTDFQRALKLYKGKQQKQVLGK